MRPLFERAQEVEDEVAEGWEVVGLSMEMEHVLFEPAPELLDGVEPGGIGGERDDLDGEIEPLGARTRLGRPGARSEEGEGRALGFEGREDVGVVMDGPVVLDEVDLASRIGLDERPIEADE